MNVPKLRFSEFNEEWKCKKIGNISKIYDGTHETPNYTTSGVKFVSVENINNLLATQKYVSKDDFDKYKIKPKINDIFMTRIGDIGTSNILLEKIDLAYYVSLALIRPNEEIYPMYLNQYIKSYFFQKELYNRTIHVAFPKKINTGEINNCLVNFPEIKEQEKISNVLALIDKKIELQSKKIEDLKLYKKGLIEQEISKLKVYKETKLSDILKERKDYSEKGLEYPHVTLSKDGIYDKGERYNRDFLVKSEDKNYKITKFNDICYNPANLKFGVICLNKYGSAIFSPIYVTFEILEDINPDFIGLYLARNNFINAVRKYEQGTVYERMSVSPDDFIKFKINIPPLEIQNKIAITFEKINNILDLENSKLFKLQELKKGLMRECKIKCVSYKNYTLLYCDKI